MTLTGSMIVYLISEIGVINIGMHDLAKQVGRTRFG